MEEAAKILIIDDSQYDRKIIKHFLEASNDNYNIVEAVTKEQGIFFIKSENPDCIILDYILPDGDGLELMDEISTDIPVLMLTGNGDEEIKQKATEKGVVDFLTKENHDMASLKNRIKFILKNSPR